MQQDDPQRRIDDLVRVVNDNAESHNRLAAAHTNLTDDLRRKDQEAADAKRLENLSKIVSVAYDKAVAYTNVIVIAGYASFFALWSTTKPVLTSRITILAVLLMVGSAALFVLFETFKMILAARFCRRSGAFLKDPEIPRNPELFQARLDEYNARNRRHDLSFVWAWYVVLALAVPAAVLAIGLLVYSYLSLLLWPGESPIGMWGYTYEAIMRGRRPAERVGAVGERDRSHRSALR